MQFYIGFSIKFVNGYGENLRRFKRRSKERKGSEKAEEKDRISIKKELKKGVEDEEVLENKEDEED